MLSIFIKGQDYSQEIENYLSDSVITSLLAGETIDIGYYKPISDLFFELKPLAQVSNMLSAVYYNGSWTSLLIHDRTRSLNRSGFISWNKGLIEDWKKTSINGKELFWIRLSLSEDIEDLEVKGINLVFSDDNDLKEAYPDIFEFVPEDQDSFIAYHQEARNFILTYLRNKGKTIRQQNKLKMLDQFDLHNFDEVRQAAKYLALANIFYNESDSVDDKWKQKADGFMSKYSEAINLNFLSIDENDDGMQQSSESNAVQFIKVRRL